MLQADTGVRNLNRILAGNNVESKIIDFLKECGLKFKLQHNWQLLQL